MQPDKLLARNRQQIEWIGVAQVVLGEERNARQVLERVEIVFGFDPGLGQAFGPQRLSLQDAGDRLAQASELERV